MTSKRKMPWLFGAARPVRAAALLREGFAGLALAALNVPQALGYSRIAGMPVVTGLYTLLIPLVAFAAFGSSRYLVVAADSATAVILAGGISPMALPGSARYVALAGAVAMLAAIFLLAARLLKLGFLSDFLSQTVLVGFLTGVGLQVAIAVLGDMLGIEMKSHRTLVQLFRAIQELPRAHLATVGLSASIVAVILLLRRVAPRFPGPLLAVVGAIGASALWDFPHHGIAVIGPVAGGLPGVGLPDVSWQDVLTLLPTAGSCFLMIVAQSAATARAFAARHRDVVDGDADLLGLSAANAGASLTGTFVVNGSPTQTAMVERSGGRSQLTHLATAGVVAIVLLCLTGPLRFLPQAALAAIVFTIAIGLVDLRGLRDILRESPGEFQLAIGTSAVVVAIGVKQGILLAVAVSLLRHVRHSYRPHTAVLVRDAADRWRSVPARPGVTSLPGVVIFQFGADLFYANVGGFEEDVRTLARRASPSVRWLVLDAGAITSIDFSASRALQTLHDDLARDGVTLLLVHAPESLRADLVRHRLMDAIGPGHVFDKLHEALAAIERGAIQPSAPPDRTSRPL